MAEADKPIVTITGISGYIGSHTALLFLQDGSYRVRGTVRDKNNEAKMAPLRTAFGELFDQLEIVEADLTNDQSLQEAIAGSTYVVHVASPFFYGSDESQLITPAVEGTLSVMRACKENNVRRCVVTSSIAANLYRERPEGLTDETMWSDPNWPTISLYAKSKVLAEKAAWDFWEALPEAERFELVTILPGFVLGPPLRSEVSTSMSFCVNALDGSVKEIWHRAFPVVDVRDCAMGHLKAIKVQEAANQRFNSTNESVWFKDLYAALHERFASEGWPVPTTMAAEPEGFDGYMPRYSN